MSKQSSYVILVNIHNTIAALNEAILEQYYLAFPGGKKKKSVDILQYAKIEDNFSSKESELIQKIYSSVRSSTILTIYNFAMTLTEHKGGLLYITCEAI